MDPQPKCVHLSMAKKRNFLENIRDLTDEQFEIVVRHLDAVFPIKNQK